MRRGRRVDPGDTDVPTGIPDEGELPTRPQHDKIPYVGLGLALVGYLPAALFAQVLGFSHFGPLAVPAIIAMVGVLFATIGLFRALDWKDQRALNWSIAAGVVGLLRLFLIPLL